MLAAAPGSAAPIAVAPVLAVIGALCGGAGGAGVGAGMSLAEASTRSWRGPALALGGALGGGIVGAAVQWLGRWTLAALVGLDVDIGGAVEGIVIGAAAGAGYAMATREAGGLATPAGRHRFYAAALTSACCGIGALLIALDGRPLVGGTVNAIARAAHGSQVTLEPLGRLIGEPDFGRVSQTVLATGEGYCLDLASRLD